LKFGFDKTIMGPLLWLLFIPLEQIIETTLQHMLTEIIGRILYTEFYYLFIIASFVLLVAMVGAIVLTHDTNTEIKRQDIFIQTSRQL